MAVTLNDKKLILFFTRGVSLSVWGEVGMFDREVEIYRRLSSHLDGVSFVTYGDESEYTFASKLNNISILPNRWRLSPSRFSILAPLLYWREMRTATFLKTNQIEGSWTAVIAKILFRKKMIARCGYLWSVFYKKESKSRFGNLRVRFLEGLAFKFADRGVVTTEAAKRYVVRNYHIDEDKMVVLPNSVNIDIFKPLPEVKKEPGRICFVGRLHPQKNPLALLEAIKGLKGITLAVVGSGPLENKLREKAKRDGSRVEFLGNIPNYQLPAELNRAELFILPSLYEGHPKTILEAMACEIPVVGTNAGGTGEVIIHKETGYLCGTSADEIRKAITELMNDEELRTKLAKNGRQIIVKNFSLEKLTDLELDVLRSLVEKSR